MINVEKNVLSKDLFNTLTKELNDKSFPWYFYSDVEQEWERKYKDIKSNFTFKSTYQFVHSFILNSKHNSPFFKELHIQLIQEIFKKFNISKGSIQRSKINLTLNNNSDTNTFNIPHVDYEVLSNNSKRKTIILYLNNSDGDTIIFNEKYGDNLKEFTLQKRITPVENSAVIFDTKYYHTGQNPIKYKKRLVLNLNFELMDT